MDLHVLTSKVEECQEVTLLTTSCYQLDQARDQVQSNGNLQKLLHLITV